MNKLQEKIATLFQSRRFYAALFTSVFTLVATEVGVDEEVIGWIVMTVSVWIIGDSLNKTK